MPFDSSKPFEVIEEPKSGFDPSQPFEPVPSSKAPPITDYSDSLGLRPEPLLNPYGPRSTTSQQRPQFSTVSELGSAVKTAELEPAFPIPRLPDVEKVPPSSLERGMINAFTAGNAPKNIDVPVQSVREAANLAIGVPEFLESGAGITAAGAGVIAPIATAAAFTADMAHSLWQQVPDLWNKWDKLTNPQRAKALVDIVGTGGLMALLGHGGIKGVKAKVEAKARESEKAPPLIQTPEPQPGEAPPITTETKGPNAVLPQAEPVLPPLRTRPEPSVQQVPTQESGGQAGARRSQKSKQQEVTTAPKTSEDFVNLKPEELAQWQSKNKYGANEDKSAGVTAQKVTSDWTIEKDLPKLMDEIDRSDDAVKEVMPAVEAAMQAGKVEEAMKALQGLQPLQNKRGRLLEFARDIPGVREQLKGVEHDEAATLAKLRSLSESKPEAKPPVPEGFKPETQGFTKEPDTYFQTKTAGNSYIQVDFNDPQGIRILGIGTRADARGKGTASGLLSEVKKIADETGKTIRLTAHAETPGSQSALNRFYEKNGFVRTGFDPLSKKPFYTYKPQASKSISETTLSQWPESEWSVASLAKQSPSERSQKAKYLGAKDKTGALQIGPKTLSALAKKRITEIKAEAARKAAPPPETPKAESPKTETPAKATEMTSESVPKTPEQMQKTLSDVMSGVFESLKAEGWKFDPQWGPLELVLKPEWLGGFMFMGKHPHPTMPGRTLFEYKNGITRRYLRVDDEGQAYGFKGDAKTGAEKYPPIPLEQAIDRVFEGIEKQGETRESKYNDAYRQKRNDALIKAGIGVASATPEGTLLSVPKPKTVPPEPPKPPTKGDAPRGTSGELYINPLGPLVRATAADLAKLSEALGITPAAKRAARKIEQYRQAFPVIMQSRPVRHIMDQTRDAADTMANNLGRQLGNRIRTGATDLEQMASAAMIAGKFDPAEFPSLIAKAQRGNHAEAEKALNYALANWTRVEPIARRGEQVFAAQLAAENAHGINTVSHEGYLPGLYDEDLWMGKGRPFIIGGKRGGVGTGFKKGKTYDSPFDAIADGYVPKSLKLGDLVENRVKRGQRLINNVEWSDSLRGILDPSDGKSVVTSVEKHARPGGLPGYETVPMGYARRLIIPGMDVAVHEEYVNLFDALTGNSHVQEFEVGGVPVGNIALETEGALKHGLLVFDTFHASRILQKELFLTKRIGYKKGFTLLEYTDADLGRAVAAGDVTPEMAAWARVNRSTANLLQKSGLNVGRVQEAMYNAAIRNIPGIGTFNRWVFEKVTRGAMLESGLIEFERVKKANPMWTDGQVAVKVARDLNKYFGNLGRQGVFKSKTFQDLSRLAFLAPQWVESMARSELGGIKQLTMDPLTKRTLHVGTLGVGMAQGLAAYFVGTQILNMVTRGHPTWENPEKGHKLDAWIPDITGKSRGYFLSPFGVVAELTHDLIKYSSQEPDVLSAAARIAKNRSSPLFRAGKILVGGEDWDKTKIQGSWNRVKKAAFALVPTPIPLQSVVRGGPPGQTQRQITSSLGVKTDPAGSPRAETVQSGREWALNSPNAKIKANAERKAKMDFGESAYKPLRSALLRGDRETIISEVKELVNREPTQEKRARRFKEILTDVNPFSSNGIKPFATPSRSKEDEIAFAKSLDANGKAAYKQAVKDAVMDFRKLTEALYNKPQNPPTPAGYEAFLK